MENTQGIGEKVLFIISSNNWSIDELSKCYVRPLANIANKCYIRPPLRMCSSRQHGTGTYSNVTVCLQSPGARQCRKRGGEGRERS